VEDKEPFIARWSRRKLEAKESAPAAAPAPPDADPAVSVVPATHAAVPGPAQGRGPEYREFFDPQVDEKLRQAALREMFSDPHFNVMDGLDIYIDDYSKSDPIPAAMLRQLNQAKGLLFEDEQHTAEGGAAAAPVEPMDTAALTEARPAGAFEEGAEGGTRAAAASEAKPQK
jgi:hypothetical protein